MCNEHPEYQNYMAIQRDVFRLAKRDHELSVARLAKLSKIPQPTVQGWANGVTMPLWAFSILTRYIPDDLTTLLMEPSGKAISSPGDSTCFDALAQAALDYAQRHIRARSPDSPGGTAIVPCEREELTHSKRKLGAKARAGE